MNRNPYFDEAKILLRRLIIDTEDEKLREEFRQILELLLDGIAEHERQLSEIRRLSSSRQEPPPSPYGNLPFRSDKRDRPTHNPSDNPFLNSDSADSPDDEEEDRDA
ncbi:MAG: hypothetical protein SF029_17500 [bacterium]|nr:hypothetical protein [bacterium]